MNNETQLVKNEDLLGCAGVTQRDGLPMIVGTADIRRFAETVVRNFPQLRATHSETKRIKIEQANALLSELVEDTQLRELLVAESPQLMTRLLHLLQEVDAAQEVRFERPTSGG